jgi:hypothetical protein
VNLCPDCIRAERDPWFIGVIVYGRLCCKARSIALSLRKDLKDEFDKATAELSPEDVAAVRVRARAIWDALQKRGIEQ